MGALGQWLSFAAVVHAVVVCCGASPMTTSTLWLLAAYVPIHRFVSLRTCAVCTWAGALAAPLDWETWWQQWPWPSCALILFVGLLSVGAELVRATLRMLSK